MEGLDERIPNDDTRWEPYIGDRVEEYIKESISHVRVLAQNAALNNGVRATYFDPTNNTLYFFDSDSDKEAFLAGDTSKVVMSQEMKFSGMVQQLKITNLAGSNTLYFTSAQETAIISCTFITQEKGVTDANWTTVSEDHRVTVAVDRGATGAFSTIESGKLVLEGATFSIDVKQYLNSGVNRVRIMAEGTTSGQSSTLIITANLTSMYLAPAIFSWNVPFKQGQAYSLGGMYIGGNLDKTLHVRMTNTEKGYNEEFTAHIGTRVYTSSAYFFQGLLFPSTGTGVYNVDIWVTADTLETEHLSYNIMCVSAADAATAKVVVVNEVAKNVTNFADSELFKYAIYNGTSPFGSPEFDFKYIINGVEASLPSDLRSDITTMEKQSFAGNIEIDTDAFNFIYQVTAKFGNAVNASVIVDNSASFPATRGASFYLSPAMRSNSQSNREYIVNQMDTSFSYKGTWTKMSWAEKADGWIYDDNGRRCLSIPAHSRLTINGRDKEGELLRPLASTVSRGRTIEFTFKCKNVSNYNDSIITIAQNASSENYYGLKIMPTSMVFHTHLQSDKKFDTAQDAPLKDGETVNVALTIVKDYKTTLGHFVFIYVNGVRQRMFSFNTNDSTVADADIVIGGDSADLYLYNMRVYETAFGNYDAFTNYISSLSSFAEKKMLTEIEESIFDDSFAELDYNKINQQGYNTMVIEVKSGKIPSFNSTAKAKADVEFHMPAIKRRFKLIGATTEGQGTTSMEYYLWNLRWRIDKEDGKKLSIAEWNYNINTWNSAQQVGSVNFDNDPNHPALKRITAKINYASSMQSHKMGATAAYNDLHEECCANATVGRVAVYQYPFYAFEKVLVEGSTNIYTHKFIGLFTIGPDKGDKPTFGFDNKTEVTELVAVEGTDHSEVLVPMNYPWDSRAIVGKNAKGNFCIGMPNASGYSYGWEVTQSGSLDDASSTYPADAIALMNREFKPAYDVVYNNSGRILGVTESIATINSNVTAFREKKSADGHAYTVYNIWCEGEYILYYYNHATSRYESTGVNLYSTHVSASEQTSFNALSLEQKNEFFIRKRLAIFRQEAGKYWDVDDVLFSIQFLEMFGASDNYGKNMYPYKLKPLANGGRWRLFQDDLDTIFDIDNQGRKTKKYSIENHDFTDETMAARVFNPEGSAFLYNFTEAFAEEYKQMGAKILAAMDKLASSGTTTLERLTSFIYDRFWGKAQDYFTKMTYNKDLELKYEAAYEDEGYNKRELALEQSMGDHYLAEREWVERRLVYLMSRYSYGAFGLYSNAELGQINWRSQSAVTLRLTPAMDLYPAIFVGQGQPTAYGARVLDGESVTMTGSATDNTAFYLNGADYYRSIGTLRNLIIDPSAQPVLNVVSAVRLEELVVGDANASLVTTNLQGLNLNCPSLELLDCRNASSLVNPLDLTKCPRLLTVLLGGTRISGISFMEGAKITQITLPNTLKDIRISNMQFLSSFASDGYDNIESIFIVGSSNFNPFPILRGAYNATNSKLRYVRITNMRATNCTADDIDLLMALATNKDKDGNYHLYNGIDADGTNNTKIIPVIEGDMYLSESAYEEAIDAVVAKFGANLHIHQSGTAAIRFADSATEAICVANWDTNKDGKLGVDEAAAVKSIGEKVFQGKAITSFNEFKYFTGLTTTTGAGFMNCSALKEITLPSTVTSLAIQSFRGTALTTIRGLENITYMGSGCFYGCGNITSMNLPALTSMGTYVFQACTKLTEFIAPNLTTLPEGTFSGVTSLVTLSIPKATGMGTGLNGSGNLKTVNAQSLQSIPNNAFYRCGSLTNLNITAGIITSIGYQAFNATPITGEYIFSACKKVDYEAFSTTKDANLVVSFPVLENLGSAAFNNSAIKEIKSLGNSITRLEGYTFYNTPNLMYIDVPASVEIISNNVFKSTNAVINIPQDNNITSIDYDSFNAVKNLAGAFSFSKLEYIGSGCFSNSGASGEGFSITALGPAVRIMASAFTGSKLTNINLSTCTEIGNRAFQNCGSLTSIGSLQRVVTMGYEVFYNSTKLASDINLSSLLELGDGVFRGCSSITTVTSLGRITSTRNNVFYGCSSLASVVLPSTLTEIGADTFRSCPKLANITWGGVTTVSGTNVFRDSLTGDLIAPNLTTISGGESFRGCGVTSVILLGLQKMTGGTVFYSSGKLKKVVLGASFSEGAQGCFNGCGALRLFVCKAATPPVIGTNFISNNTNLRIYIPNASVDNYKVADNWSGYASKIYGYTEVSSLPSTASADEYYLYNNDIYQYDASEAFWNIFDTTYGYFVKKVDYYSRLIGVGGTNSNLDLGINYDASTIVTLDFVNSSNTGSVVILMANQSAEVRTMVQLKSSSSTSIDVGIAMKYSEFTAIPTGVPTNSSNRISLAINLAAKTVSVNGGAAQEVNYNGTTAHPNAHWVIAGAVTFYGIKVTNQSGVELHDFRPASVGGQAGLFDTITEKFVKCATSGKYSVAND